MDKEEFLKYYCAQYEETCCAYDLFAPYLNVLEEDYVGDLDDLQKILESALSQIIVSYLFGTYFDDDGTIQDELAADLDEQCYDNWSCCSIEDHGVLVYINDAKILVRELAADHNISLKENLDYTDSDFLCELNSCLNYKFYA